MRRSPIAAAALLAGLSAVPALPCTVPSAPRMLVPASGATDVTWRRPILLLAVPASDGGTVALAEVLGDGGLQPVSASSNRVTYPSPVEGRMTVLPSAPLTPDASYALTWVNPPLADVPLGTFATGPAAGNNPYPFPFSATRFPYRTRGDAGTCAVDSCAVYGFGSNSLVWNVDGGQTFLWISDGSGATVAYGVLPYDRAWYVCHPDAQAGGVFSGFTVESDGGSRTFGLTFLTPSGIVALATQTLDLSCTEFDPGPQCRPPDAGLDAGEDQDAGPDGGDTTPPPGSCGCGAAGGGAALLALFVLGAALRRPWPKSTGTRSDAEVP